MEHVRARHKVSTQWTTAVNTIFLGSESSGRAVKAEEASQELTTSKWQSWAGHLPPVALLLGFLPHGILEDDWDPDWGAGAGGEDSSGKSPPTSDRRSSTPALPPWPRPYPFRWLPPQGPFPTNEKKPRDARVMEHRGPEPRGADTAETDLQAEAHPALCTTGRPSPLLAR